MKTLLLFFITIILSAFTFAQSVNVKDGDSNTLLQVNDEGTTGSITLPSLSSIDTSTGKLYNLSGSLYWNGTLVGLGGAAEINDLTDAIYDGSSLFLGNGAGINDDGTSNYNTAVGTSALYNNTTGSYNNATGISALYNNTTGVYNNAAGVYALPENTTGSYNTANGNNALQYNKTGNYNTAIGYFSGPNYSYTNLSNTTAIGNSARVSADNQVRIGNSSVTSIGGYAAWSNLSDGRYKRNIKEDVSGLEFIMGLRPITYNLDMNLLTNDLREDVKLDENGSKTLKEPNSNVITSRSKKAGTRNTGFIAQEVEELAKRLDFDFSGVEVPENENAMYSLRYAEFVVPLVKGMQEQQKMIKKQQAIIEGLKVGMSKEQQEVIGELKEEIIQLKREFYSQKFSKTGN